MGAEEEPQTKSETLSDALRLMHDSLKGSGWHVVLGRRGQFRLIPYVNRPEGTIGSASVAPQPEPDDEAA